MSAVEQAAPATLSRKTLKKVVDQLLIDMCNEQTEITPGGLTITRIQKVLNALIKEAENGREWAIKELLDRSIGKPTQVVETEGDIVVAVIRGGSISEL